MIVGIDEVGRGPWAGPLVVGAVLLGCEIDGLTDSKKISKKRREQLSIEIYEKAIAVGLGWVHSDELDEIGLSASLVEATKRALIEIRAPYQQIIIDGTVNFLQNTGKGPYVTTMKKADLLIPSVSAASIVAKVARDRFMAEQHELYPDYGFSANSGYGTAKHRAAIELYGATPIHRLSFSPLAKYRADASIKSGDRKLSSQKTTLVIGSESEEVATKELIRLGHEIITRNWKTKYCEIDIISKLGDKLYFVEVKHRKNSFNGDGLAAITPKKIKQMKFAARLYLHSMNIQDSEVGLMAVSTEGDPAIISNIVDITD